MKSRKGIFISIQKAQYYIVLISLIPALIIISISENKRAHQWETITAQEALNQANSIAQFQYSITESTRQMLATLAALPEFKELNTIAMKPILQNIHAQNNAYLNFTALNAQGVIMASSRLEPGVSLKGRPHIEAVLRNARFSPGSYIVGLVENTPSFSYAYPIISEQGALIGAIAATYKLSSYETYIKELTISKDTVLGIVDRYGTRLFYYPPSATNPLGKPIKYEVWERMLQGKERDVFLMSGSDGIKRFYAYAKLKLVPDEQPYMYVVYGIPYQVIMDRVLPILYQELALILGTMGLAILLTRLSYKSLFGHRLSALIDFTRFISHEQETFPKIEPDPTKDLGIIQKALYSMYTTLQDQNRKQQEYDTALQKAIQEKTLLIKEVHHRVKNDFQLIQSLINLESVNCENIEAFKEAIESRITSMSLVHQMLYETTTQGCIDLAMYAREIIGLLINIKGTNFPISLDFQTEAILAPVDTAITFGLLLNELVMNSLKHGLSSEQPSRFTLILTRQVTQVHLEFSDSGPGFPDDFSFATSKGLGIQLAIGLAEQLGGTLRWENNEGARFILDFPHPPI
ncbi:sensor histidine kinase [Gracilinema caldarium]|uniref:histidine kinase n=1 Tax=Gracilinema caldarium (strain ATCC 51460 / DSM 7334 / H1) TaxID=744872 RepID=F8F059_GRAC1|nr:histidine kinase dimerization/phosphoacceptor domain -containing protein [Gracilinema caldarium]AEJ18712.1 signal transduction histidine kinase [Gracilinema caldarium DSM 7334]